MPTYQYHVFQLIEIPGMLVQVVNKNCDPLVLALVGGGHPLRCTAKCETSAQSQAVGPGLDAMRAHEITVDDVFHRLALRLDKLDKLEQTDKPTLKRSCCRFLKP